MGDLPASNLSSQPKVRKNVFFFFHHLTYKHQGNQLQLQWKQFQLPRWGDIIFFEKDHRSLCKFGSVQLIDQFLKISVLQADF